MLIPSASEARKKAIESNAVQDEVFLHRLLNALNLAISEGCTDITVEGWPSGATQTSLYELGYIVATSYQDALDPTTPKVTRIFF